MRSAEPASEPRSSTHLRQAHVVDTRDTVGVGAILERARRVAVTKVSRELHIGCERTAVAGYCTKMAFRMKRARTHLHTYEGEIGLERCAPRLNESAFVARVLNSLICRCKKSDVSIEECPDKQVCL